MNGIDTALASVLSSRIDSLLSIAPGTATTSQTGAAGVGTAAPTNPTPAPQPSAQTALSAVALTLNAIAHSGGEATPAVLGRVPIWAAAPALDIAIGNLPLTEAAGGAAADSTAANSTAASNTNPNAATGASATASVAATEVPVGALAAALEQTVADSGLFYEAHLAAWLVGQCSPAELANEAQNQLVAQSQLPPDWSAGDGDANAWSAASNAAPDATPRGAPNGAQSAASNSAENNTAMHTMPSILTAQAARLVAGELLANSVSDLNGQSAHTGLHSATPQATDAGSSQSAQAIAAAVHPATVPLVRQQLDLLATGQFRWTGEAWPGARLDWTIEQDGDEWDRGGGGRASEEDQPWRTRLTLSLPTLGTVDAELTLTGRRLIARVQTSPRGAARLATQGDDFRQRLAAAGIELHGLTIREIGGGAPGTSAAGGSAAGAQAASAYARSAASAVTAAGASAAARDDFDWDI